MDLDELERLLEEARNGDEMDMAGWSIDHTPRLLALVRAGDRLATAVDRLMLQGDVFASQKGGDYKYLAMLLHAHGDAVLAAWRETRDGA